MIGCCPFSDLKGRDDEKKIGESGLSARDGLNISYNCDDVQCSFLLGLAAELKPD